MVFRTFNIFTLVIVLGSTCICGCASESEPKEAVEPSPAPPPPPFLCPNQEVLLHYGSFDLLEADPNGSDSGLLDIIDAILDDPECQRTRKFALPFDPDEHSWKRSDRAIAVPVYLFDRDCGPIPNHNNFKPRCDVLINEPGMILMEGYLCSPDSFSDWLVRHFRDTIDGYFAERGSTIGFDWDSLAPPKLVSRLIQTVPLTYLQEADREAAKRFGRSICELSERELLAFRKDHPLKILLNFMPPLLPLPVPDWDPPSWDECLDPEEEEIEEELPELDSL